MAKKNISKKDKASKINRLENKTVKKTLKPKKKEKKDKSSGIGIFIILVIVAIVAVLAINYQQLSDSTVFSTNYQKLSDKFFNKNTTTEGSEVIASVVAASVNGDIITLSQLDNIYSRLPEQTKMAVSKQDILEQIINEKILILEAENKGINVSDKEINDFIDDLILKSGMVRDEFEQRIYEQNLSMDTVTEEIFKQLIITKLYEQEIINKINITDEEIQAYYDENQEQFKTEEQAKARHILICHQQSISCESNLTQEQALQKIQNISDLVNGTNFSELAKKYSMGPSSASGGDLGFFGKGVMIKEFEDVAFDTEIGQVSDIVETSFGYHLIKVDDKKNESIEKLEEVKEDIKSFLIGQNQQFAFKEYLDKLKSKANIINFYENSVAATTG